MRALSLLILFVFVAASLPSSAVAQGRSAVRASGAPVVSRMSVGVQRLKDVPAPLPTPAPFRADTRQNRALMIVGGAGMLTGLVIGDDAGTLISVGGAVVFLWGLYQYVQ